MPARNSAAHLRVAIITRSFRCPTCEIGVCDIPRPAMIVSGGRLRPATEDEISELAKREMVSWELKRVPGLGKEGLARFLAERGAPVAATPEGFLVTCTCGHLLLDELPGD